MSGVKQNGISERLSAARDAKRAMVAKCLQQPGPDDPAVTERRAARTAVNAARNARIAEREERAAAVKVASDARLEAERKAARDARYPARSPTIASDPLSETARRLTDVPQVQSPTDGQVEAARVF